MHMTMIDELAVVEYVEDLHKYYKETEDDGRVQDYMNGQLDISAKMRTILVDWRIEVHRKFELNPEALYLTVNILDRYLSMQVIPRSELQLVGMGVMLVACKYEEIWAPEVNDFIGISNYAYENDQTLLGMEKRILEKLEWYLTVHTPCVILVRYIKASIPYDFEVENMVFFYSELGFGKCSRLATGRIKAAERNSYTGHMTLWKRSSSLRKCHTRSVCVYIRCGWKLFIYLFFLFDSNIAGSKLGDVSINIDWKTGIAAKDWDFVAKKEQIEGVELELRKLEGAIEAIHENCYISRAEKARCE